MYLVACWLASSMAPSARDFHLLATSWAVEPAGVQAEGVTALALALSSRLSMQQSCSVHEEILDWGLAMEWTENCRGGKRRWVDSKADMEARDRDWLQRSSLEVGLTSFGFFSAFQLQLHYVRAVPYGEVFNVRFDDDHSLAHWENSGPWVKLQKGLGISRYKQLQAVLCPVFRNCTVLGGALWKRFSSELKSLGVLALPACKQHVNSM